MVNFKMKLIIVVALVGFLHTCFANSTPEGIFASADGAIRQSTGSYEDFLTTTSNGKKL